MPHLRVDDRSYCQSDIDASEFRVRCQKEDIKDTEQDARILRRLFPHKLIAVSPGPCKEWGEYNEHFD